MEVDAVSVAEQDTPLGPGLSSDIDKPGVPPGISVLEHVHALEQRLSSEERPPKILAIPIWDGAIAIKYAYPEQGATPIIRAGMMMATQDPAKAVDAAITVILGAAFEVVAKRPEDEDWQPLDPSGQPVSIGPRLAGMLNFDVPQTKRPARYVARMLFSLPAWRRNQQFEGDIALVSQAGEVTEWLRGEHSEIQDHLEGE